MIGSHRMPSEIMDQRHFCMPSAPTTFFSEEIRFPAERQVGFWKAESVPDHRGTEGISLMLGSKSVSSSSFGKLRPVGAHSVERVELSQPGIFDNHKTKFSHEQNSLGTENSSGLSMAAWRGSRSDLYVQPASLFIEGNKVNMNGSHHENGLFPSTLLDMFDKKLRLSSSGVLFGQSVDTVNTNFAEDEPFESLEEIEAQTIGNLLPDDDDLLSGLIDDLEYGARPNSSDDVDDDLFYSGGGMELEADDTLNCNKTSDFLSEISPNCQQGGTNSSFAGEHPFGEHPSRTLFVRNINSNVEDAELRVLFEQYGDIRTLYTACKHRGFVMISYYDIRAARNAMRALQNKPLRRRKLDIHFSIPKDNPSEKDINQGTLVVFNLDSSVSNEDLRQIFGVYGEIKEIRETPHKRHHKFIEYYDVRAAETALRALNRSDIAGKKIKLEPSRPGGARRCAMQQLSPELEQEDSAGCRQGSPPDNSSSGHYGSIPLGGMASNGLDTGVIPGLDSAVRAPISPYMETAFHGISSSVPNCLSSPIRVASIGNHSQSGICEPSHSLGHLNLGFQSMLPFHPHSLPESHDGTTNGISFNTANSMSSMGVNMGSRPAEGIDLRHMLRLGSGVVNVNGHSFEESAFGVTGNGSCPLHGHQYLLDNSSSYHHHSHAPMIWSSSPSFMNSIPAHAPHQMHGLARSPSHLLNSVLPLHHHHVGSAPAVNPTLRDMRHVYGADSAEAPGFHPGSLGSMGFPGSSQLHPLELASHNIFPHAGGNCMDPSLSSAHTGIPSPQQRGPMFHGRNPMIPMPSSFDAPSDRIRSRRSDASANQADNKKQYELDIERIVRGEDSRTTLMIKNIPNKYTSKMLLATIDEHHRGTYDFIYLPIDFKNKCNVGYAFINMIDPQQIIPFYQAFNGKKWEKFNSEKVASLAYARIQGKAALIAHFQNSSLMNEDKRCRPILFHTDGPNAGDQEPFPVGPNIRSRPGRSRNSSSEENHQGSPPSSANGEESSNGMDSSLSSTKDSE